MKQPSLFDEPPQGHANETGETLTRHYEDTQSDEQACARPGGSQEFPFRELSFDIEATGKDPLSDTAVGVALCKEKGKAFYVPVRHVGGPNVEEAFALLKAPLESERIAKIGHNLKYDILMMRKEGVRVRGTLYDTMLASYLLNPNKPNHSLQDVSIERLAHKKRSFAEVLGGSHSFAEVPVEEATRYAAEDAALALELKEILFTRLPPARR